MLCCNNMESKIPTKCIVVWFGAHHTKNNVISNYNIDGRILEFHLTTILVNLRLQLHEHVQSVAQKAGGLTGELLRSAVYHYSSFIVFLFISQIRIIIDFWF